jgi:hypothetical protein
VWNKQIAGLIVDLEKELEMIVKWLRDSGLQVNTGKTESRGEMVRVFKGNQCKNDIYFKSKQT